MADNELYMETFSTGDLTGFLCCLRRQSGTLPYLSNADRVNQSFELRRSGFGWQCDAQEQMDWSA
jgi:hypothetical protein